MTESAIVGNLDLVLKTNNELMFLSQPFGQTLFRRFSCIHFQERRSFDSQIIAISNQKGGVVHTEILLSPHAPHSFSDHSVL